MIQNEDLIEAYVEFGTRLEYLSKQMILNNSAQQWKNSLRSVPSVRNIHVLVTFAQNVLLIELENIPVLDFTQNSTQNSKNKSFNSLKIKVLNVSDETDGRPEILALAFVSSVQYLN